jgi:hypothetical protein
VSIFCADFFEQGCDIFRDVPVTAEADDDGSIFVECSSVPMLDLYQISTAPITKQRPDEMHNGSAEKTTKSKGKVMVIPWMAQASEIAFSDFERYSI